MTEQFAGLAGIGNVTAAMTEQLTGLTGIGSVAARVDFSGLTVNFTAGLDSISASVTGLFTAGIDSSMSVMERFTTAINSFGIMGLFTTVLESYSGIFGNLQSYAQKAFLKCESVTKEADHIFIKYKWLITPSLELWLLDDIVKVYRDPSINNKKKYHLINRLITNYFADNNFQILTSVVESWKQNPLFKPGIKKIRDCLWVLKNKDRRINPSNVVLPTLIAQIDGILSDYLKAKGWEYKIQVNSKGKEIGKWIDQTGGINGKFDTNLSCLKDNGYLNSDLIGIHIESPRVLLFNILFQKALYNYDPKIPFTYCRPKVMHGERKNYGRIDNTIRAFLTLDFLANLD
jgi:hypothetical protein